jgi:single-strand DNA-binding protein
MLVIRGITKDATINTLKDDRMVVNFSIAVNDYYKPKGASEPKKFTTYINCSYWISARIAERLKKGTLVDLSGRIFVSAYTDMKATPKPHLIATPTALKFTATVRKSNYLKHLPLPNKMITQTIYHFKFSAPSLK